MQTTSVSPLAEEGEEPQGTDVSAEVTNENVSFEKFPFKAGAVRMVTEQGRPSREVAAELGICIDTLRSWLKAAGAPSPGQADRQNRDARRLRELEAEIRALRKKLEEKDGVIDILKKSVGILSKP